jgi:pimeloyl-ACP methyl ester carboxylesterase
MPQRAKVGVLISGLGPLGDPRMLARMSPASRRVLQLGRRFPWLMRAFLRMQKHRARADPEAFLGRLIREWSVTDGEHFTRPEVRSAFLGDVRQVFLEGEPVEGMTQELQLYFRWGFRLGEVAADARVLLWHGRHDVVVPPAMALHAARRLPGAEVTLLPGGHFTVIGHAEELVRRTREALED